MFLHTYRLVATCVARLLAVPACTGPRNDADLPEFFIRVDVDKSEPKRLLTYYFGGYVSPDPADPFDGMLADTPGHRDGATVDRDAALIQNLGL